MAYVPDIIDYKPFYIQTDVDAGAINTTTWGMVAKTNPFPVLPTPKEVYKNEWLDEDGDDEYNAEMYYEAYEFDVQFYMKTIGESSEATLVAQLDSFFDKIKAGEFKIYDSFTGVGRQSVRYAGFQEEEFRKGGTGANSWARTIFTIKFKVNDPITRISLINGALQEV